jgi:hypothetical protein
METALSATVKPWVAKTDEVTIQICRIDIKKVTAQRTTIKQEKTSTKRNFKERNIFMTALPLINLSENLSFRANSAENTAISQPVNYTSLSLTDKKD